MKPSKELEQWMSNRLNDKTATNYLQIIRLLAVEESDIQDMARDVLGKTLTNFIEKKWTRLFAVKTVLNFYNRTDVIGFLPKPKNIRRERRHKKKSIPFSAIKSVVTSSNNQTLKALIMLQYETGARIDEVLDMRCEDIDFDNKKVVVGGRKGSNSRTITLTAKTFLIINKFVNSRKKGRVFSIKYSWAEKMYKEAFRKLNPDISSHWMRTSRAVHLHEAGFSPIQIMELLGHKNLQSTYSYLREAGINISEMMEKSKPEW